MTLSMVGCTSVNYDDLKGKWYCEENNVSLELCDDEIIATDESGIWWQMNPKVKSKKIVTDAHKYGAPDCEIIKEDGEYFLIYDGFRYTRVDDE